MNKRNIRITLAVAALMFLKSRALFLFMMDFLSIGGLFLIFIFSIVLLFKKGMKAFLLCLSFYTVLSSSIWLLNVFYKPYDMKSSCALSSLCALCDELTKTCIQNYTESFDLEAILNKTPKVMNEKSAKVILVYKSSFMENMKLSGLFIPFTGHSLVNGKEPSFLIPFISAHELAHRKGILNEGQANMHAFLMCMQSDEPSFRYSASVYALKYSLIYLKEKNEAEYFRLVSKIPTFIINDLNQFGAINAGRNTPFSNYRDIVPLLIHAYSITSHGVTNETSSVFSVPSSVTKTPATRFSPAFLLEKAARI